LKVTGGGDYGTNWEEAWTWEGAEHDDLHPFIAYAITPKLPDRLSLTTTVDFSGF